MELPCPRTRGAASGEGAHQRCRLQGALSYVRDLCTSRRMPHLDALMSKAVVGTRRLIATTNARVSMIPSSVAPPNGAAD